MKNHSVLVLLLFLIACAGDGPEATSGEPGAVHTLSCPESWDKCYLLAEKLCRPSGFEEVDRATDSSMTTVGRAEQMNRDLSGTRNEVYREDQRHEVYGRTLSVRCK